MAADFLQAVVFVASFTLVILGIYGIANALLRRFDTAHQQMARFDFKRASKRLGHNVRELIARGCTWQEIESAMEGKASIKTLLKREKMPARQTFKPITRAELEEQLRVKRAQGDQAVIGFFAGLRDLDREIVIEFLLAQLERVNDDDHVLVSTCAAAELTRQRSGANIAPRLETILATIPAVGNFWYCWQSVQLAIALNQNAAHKKTCDCQLYARFAVEPAQRADLLVMGTAVRAQNPSTLWFVTCQVCWRQWYIGEDGTRHISVFNWHEV